MYKFTDTIGDPESQSLPAEVLSINGTYIENEVAGYTTLSVSGRVSGSSASVSDWPMASKLFVSE